MSWLRLQADIRDTAKLVLTDKQLDAWMLTLAGCSRRRAATMLGITKTSLQDRLDAADHALEQAGIVKDADGNYYRKKAA